MSPPSGASQNVVTVVNAQSKLVRLEELGVSPGRVTRGTVACPAGGCPRPIHLAPDDYVGDPCGPDRLRRPGGGRRGDHGVASPT